ncbi:MAG TPA: FtsX-like permease family protein [Dehalococcoidia bacterium]
METLFGIRVQVLMWTFLGLTAVIAAWSVLVTLRQPVLVRLSLRNLPRRLGRTVLIVTGLMLATTIISAAFTVGDTVARTIRTDVIASLGQVDEVVSVQEEGDIEVTGESAPAAYFDAARFQELRAALADDPNIDGLMPLIWETAGVQSPASRRTEPRVTVFAADPAFMDGFGTIRREDGAAVTLADLAPDEVYLNREAADGLAAAPGDPLLVYGPAGPREVTVNAVVRYDGGGTTTTEPGLLMRLATAQQLFQREGQVKHIAVSNQGDAESGAALTDQVLARVRPAAAALGLAVEPTKREDLQTADEAGDAFSTFFVTFGSFAIAAGIMLIFLIFVMLAAERKPEMGISRAIGAERQHLVQMFAFEGLAYDVFAAAVGALAGVAVAWVMTALVATAMTETGVELRRTVTVQSLVTAATMGVVLTFLVVTVSAWRVSVLNVVAAIRNLPEQGRRTGRASLVWGVVLLAAGLLLLVLGYSSRQMTPFGLGLSFVILAAVPILRWRGAPDRAAFTAPAVVLLVWWLLPADALDAILPEMESDFNLFITAGLIMVTAATWVVMYNSDLLLRPAMAAAGRAPGVLPSVKAAVTYPLANRFRTGVTLAMFTLVVFTLVIGAIMTTSFTEAYDDVALYGGGFDIRAETVRTNPVEDLRGSIAAGTDVDPEDVQVVADQSLLVAEARQAGTDRAPAPYPLRGLDDAFLDATTFGMAAIAEGYGSPQEVWAALKANPTLAVVDGLPAPRRARFAFGGPQTDFQLEGFFVEDGTFAPFQVEVRDPTTGAATQLTVIGVLQDVVPPSMVGISTSQRTVEQTFPAGAQPNAHFLRLRPGADVDQVAAGLESAFLGNGLEAVVLQEELDDSLAVSRSFNYVVEGFLGLGLVVGVAALGVVTARSVVERRHEIGIMRAIGFERGRVQLSILLESSMVAVVGIVTGTALAFATALNIIRDTREQPSWANLELTVPWLALGVIFGVVLVAAVITAYLPARRASWAYPAEALRYE